jgi:pimeloyl-ACP methyl ester carboxylesterase
MVGTAAAFDGRSRLVLLVHGYNVPEDKAVKEFDGFIGSILKLAPGLNGQIGIMLWPGDYRPVWSWASYPWRVHTAINCAKQLAEYLLARRDMNGNIPEVILIAHSLGCRLVLEALKLLPSDHRLSIKIILMAAAYPVALLKGPKAALQVKTAKAAVVLYSDSDKVLRFLFPAGERIARTAGSEPVEAVGLNGLPDAGVWSERTPMHAHKHGDYWKSERVRDAICRSLGFLVTNRPWAREVPQGTLKKRSWGDRYMPFRDVGQAGP